MVARWVLEPVFGGPHQGGIVEKQVYPREIHPNFFPDMLIILMRHYWLLSFDTVERNQIHHEKRVTHQFEICSDRLLILKAVNDILSICKVPCVDKNEGISIHSFDTISLNVLRLKYYAVAANLISASQTEDRIERLIFACAKSELITFKAVTT